ncbi:M20/M25/M40 family metallo-hydrolase [Sphingomonas sp. M1-B02]|uniref:M20/M25/M40 family metallo-hydrolase n=1 Tax=Sphingomonas sp. M1-B02 TaxID=3114300 RepID=UPI00223F7797|nr:M20/M25/M40 family metallo-hydrolase [Sphingomonas sp. S6-11]UZK64625.1 M20/M25/M40 family metallo-hydrolase [Sphingomonas sp. S6-11]
MRTATAIAALMLAATPVVAQTVDRTEVARIVDEGTADSEVMRIAQYLTDVIGPRLTNSPGMRRAEDWTAAKFREWGLSNVHKEGFEFGRGWESEGAFMRLIEPRAIPLTIAPITWTPGTAGTMRAPIVLAALTDPGALAQYKGKLARKIVLVSDPEEPKDADTVPFRRWTDAELAKFDTFEMPANRPRPPSAGRTFAQIRDDFLKAEGAVAYATMSGRPGKIVHGSGSRFGVGDTPPLPGFEIAQEDYRRLARLSKMGAAPVVEFASAVRFDDSDTQGYNIIGDIAGSDSRAGYVMAGAHLDSWAAGDGAADNAAGVAMVMEAARIIRALGIKPKRTIRFALWSGEEQGLFGSLNYVERHLAARPVEEGITGLARFYGWTRGWPITPKPDHARLAAYFNIDNGSGRIRGINTQNNSAVVPIFKEWLAPFESMGATQVAIRKVGGTDHMFFDAVGIPAFQFIQDPLDYGSLRHHTNLDTFDALRADDMRQGAIILAAFLVNAANSDRPLPRVPMPTEPKPSDGLYPYTAPAAN